MTTTKKTVTRVSLNYLASILAQNVGPILTPGLDDLLLMCQSNIKEHIDVLDSIENDDEWTMMLSTASRRELGKDRIRSYRKLAIVEEFCELLNEKVEAEAKFARVDTVLFALRGK